MYETPNQYLAAVLMCFLKDQYDSARSEQLNGRKQVTFVFHDKKACEEVVSDHMSGLLTASTYDFVKCIELVRSTYKNL